MDKLTNYDEYDQDFDLEDAQDDDESPAITEWGTYKSVAGAGLADLALTESGVEETEQFCSAEAAEDPIDSALRVLASANITRNGDSVRATLPQRTDVPTPGQDINRIRFERNLSFNATINGNTINLTNIEGLKADPGALAPWIHVTGIKIEGDRATITAGRFGVYSDQTFDLDAGSFNQIKDLLRRSNILP